MSAPTDRTILRVGLTGNIGAGKSTVAAMMEEAGCLIVDADDLTHRLLASGGDAVDAVIAEWGDALRSADGGVDRARLGQAVFADPAQRRRLEELLHPRIRALESARVDAWKVDAGIAVTEAALLVETGAAARYDRLVVVVAPEQERLRRLQARGMEAADAMRRMAAQMPEEEKAAAADYLIDNGGALAATATQVSDLMSRLRIDLDRRRAAPSDRSPAR